MDSGKNILRYTQPVLAGDKNKKSFFFQGRAEAGIKNKKHAHTKIFFKKKYYVVGRTPTPRSVAADVAKQNSFTPFFLRGV